MFKDVMIQQSFASVTNSWIIKIIIITFIKGYFFKKIFTENANANL